MEQRPYFDWNRRTNTLLLETFGIEVMVRPENTSFPEHGQEVWRYGNFLGPPSRG